MKMNVQMKNPEEVKSLIKNSGLSLNGFSKKIHVSQPTLTKILSGKHNPYPPTAKKIAKGLGLSIKDIFFTDLACKSKTNQKKGVS